MGGIILALKNSNFFVGNNSGPLNLAAALKIPSFGLIANDPVDELKFSKINIITPENYTIIYKSRKNYSNNINTILNEIKKQYEL